MEPVLKTGGQKCLVDSNPTPSVGDSLAAMMIATHQVPVVEGGVGVDETADTVVPDAGVVE